jgi:hypothetical protein
MTVIWPLRTATVIVIKLNVQTIFLMLKREDTQMHAYQLLYDHKLENSTLTGFKINEPS